MTENKDEKIIKAPVSESKEKKQTVDTQGAIENNETNKDSWLSDDVAPKKLKNVANKISKPKKGKKKKVLKVIKRGKAYIQATYNNTIISFTDPNGNVISWCSAGVVGFKGPKKATPYAAGVIVKQAAESARERGLEEVSVFIKGVGMGREGAIRAIAANGINITSIKDTTPIPHNGCRPKKIRRV